MMHESKGCVLAKRAENSFSDQGEFVARRCRVVIKLHAVVSISFVIE